MLNGTDAQTATVASQSSNMLGVGLSPADVSQFALGQLGIRGGIDQTGKISRDQARVFHSQHCVGTVFPGSFNDMLQRGLGTSAGMTPQSIPGPGLLVPGILNFNMPAELQPAYSQMPAHPELQSAYSQVPS